MSLILSAVSLCLIETASGGWLRDVISPRGWHVREGLVLHLVDSRTPNSTFLERHSIVMDYGGFGVSMVKLPKRSALELGFHANGAEEGRGYRGGQLMNVIIGYKLASIVAIAVGSVGMVVFKAVGLAKVAVIASLLFYIAKLLHKKPAESGYRGIPAHVEVEHPPQLHSGLVDLPSAPGNEYYFPSASDTYYSHSAPSGPSGIDYIAAASSPDNQTFLAVPGYQQVSRRRDASKRKRLPLVTIHEYSAKSRASY